MRTSMRTIATAIALLVPVMSWAQSSNGPLTREQVRAQLIQLERAGYNPAQRDNETYPTRLQAAEARVAAQNGTVGTATTGVGGTTNGSSASGHSVSVAPFASNALFRHH